MRQPRKSVLRETLASAADRIEALTGEVDRWKREADKLAAMLEGEAKCFAAGFICCGLCAVAAWWVFA